MVTNGEMLKVLQKTKFPKNTGRKNILKGKQEYSRSLVVGKVKMMYGGRPDGRQTADRRQTWADVGQTWAGASLVHSGASHPIFRGNMAYF